MQWADVLSRAGGIDITERLRPAGGANPICYDTHHWSVAGHQRVAAIVKEQITAPSAGRPAP